MRAGSTGLHRRKVAGPTKEEHPYMFFVCFVKVFLRAEQRQTTVAQGSLAECQISGFLDCMKARNLAFKNALSRSNRDDRREGGYRMARNQPVASDDKSDHEPEKGASLNFKVNSEFKKQFKGFAVAQGISMTDLLKEGFALSQKERQK